MEGSREHLKPEQIQAIFSNVSGTKQLMRTFDICLKKNC
jgi:hypothetical protein